ANEKDLTSSSGLVVRFATAPRQPQAGEEHEGTSERLSRKHRGRHPAQSRQAHSCLRCDHHPEPDARRDDAKEARGRRVWYEVRRADLAVGLSRALVVLVGKAVIDDGTYETIVGRIAC